MNTPIRAVASKASDIALVVGPETGIGRLGELTEAELRQLYSDAKLRRADVLADSLYAELQRRWRLNDADDSHLESQYEDQQSAGNEV